MMTFEVLPLEQKEGFSVSDDGSTWNILSNPSVWEAVSLGSLGFVFLGSLNMMAFDIFWYIALSICLETLTRYPVNFGRRFTVVFAEVKHTDVTVTIGS